MFVFVAVLVHKEIFLFRAATRTATAATAARALRSLWRHLIFLVSCGTLARAVDKLLDERPQAVVVLNAGHFESVIVGAAEDGEIFPVGAAHSEVVQCTHVDWGYELVRVA